MDLGIDVDVGHTGRPTPTAARRDPCMPSGRSSGAPSGDDRRPEIRAEAVAIATDILARA